VPLTGLIAATRGLLLLHVPPPKVLDSVIAEPIHKPVAPVIAGDGFTVNILVTIQPVPSE